MRSIPTVVALVSGLALLITACAPPGASQGGGRSQPEAQSAPKRIAVGILGEPHTLSQAINTAGTGSIRGVGEVERMIHTGVTILNGKGDRVPALAEQSVTIENGLWKVLPDGTMETRWTIRPDARWHDGTPVTAEDLVFTVRASLDKELAFGQGAGFNAIGNAEAVDARTVLMKWKNTYIEADQLFSYGYLLPFPKHLLEPQYVNNKAAFMELPYWTTEFIGAGPYRVTNFQRGAFMEMKAYDNFVLGKPKISDVVVKFLQDPNVLVANLLAGELEMTLGRGLSLEQGLEMQRRWNGRMEAQLGSWLAHYPQQGVYANPQALREVNFRRALLHSLDRQTISDELVGGRSPVAHSILTPQSPDYAAVASSIVKYDFDVRRAGQLLEQLGYIKQADGLYYDGAGQKLGFRAQTNAGDDFKDKMLFSSADQWKRAGIDVEVYISPRQQASDREYRATLPGTDLVRQPFDPARLISKDIPTPQNNWVGSNRTGWSDPEHDRLADLYYVTIPLNERRQHIAGMMKILTEQAMPLGVIYDVGPVMISARMLNVAENLPEGVAESWNSHEWDYR